VSISPGIPDYLQEKLASCLGDITGAYPSVESADSAYPDLGQNEAYLWWGDSAHFQHLQTADALVFKVTDLELGVLIHPDNPLDTIALPALRGVFAGRSTYWTDLAQQSPELQVEVWVLPEDHLVQDLFERAVMQGVPITNSARVAPDLSSMAEAVQEHPSAIGLAVIDPSAEEKILPVQPTVEDLRQPVLLIFPDPAPDYAAELANCLLPSQ
jgi:hypothetical protein